MRTWSFAHVAIAVALLAAASAAPADTLRERQARSLLASAQRRIAIGTPEQRQFARGELEEALRCDGTNVQVALALGRSYLAADMLLAAGRMADAVADLDSASADACTLHASIWRRRWLIQADELARDRAIVAYARSVRLAPAEYARWAPLVPLLVDAGEDDQAFAAARLAARGTPSNPEARLLVAYTAQRKGDLALAEALFRQAIPQLPSTDREQYADLSPLVPPWLLEEYRDLAPAERARRDERFWRESDPDPVTPENEARLEFWTRVTQARLLWGRTSVGEWDMRAQLYIRYGPPGSIERNPLLDPEAAMLGNWLVWTYPDLGMRVWMEARNPLAGYGEPFSRLARWVRPYRDSLARREDLAAVQNDWALFHRLPPAHERMPVRCAVARFEADDGPRVLAHAETMGSPGDVISVEWAVQDSAYAEVARASAMMVVSACRPTEGRAASWTSALPPGHYRLGVHLTDPTGRLGVERRDFVVSPGSEGLALSDLVVTCGAPELSALPGAGVRIEPETGLFPQGHDQLNAYFEIYHLAPGTDGESRFEYFCTVRAANADHRSWLSRAIAPHTLPASIEMTRQAVTRGPLRRQFLSVPVRGLPRGTYEIEVRVRDVSTGDEAVRIAGFVRGE